MSTTAPRVKTTLYQKAFLLLFGFLLVIALEGVLRIAGVGGPTGLYVKTKDGRGREVYVTNQALNRRLFFPVTGDKTNFPRPQMPYSRFSVKKDPGTFRFFTAGASSSVAMPYGPNAAFTNFLREMIAAGMPGAKVEGINASMTAVSSYQVGRWVGEILDRYDPDLVLVYTGHNEFYGVLGAGSAMSVGPNRTVTRIFQSVQETAIYALLAGAIEKVKRPREGAPRAQPLESLTRDRQIRVDGPMHRATEAAFRENLEEMASKAERKRVPIVFCAPVSNRAACGPMGPMHREDFPEESLPSWDRTIQTGDSYLRLGELDEARTEYLRAAKEDSTHAGLLFRLGLLEANRGEWGAARRYLDEAVLHDGVRLRASDRIVDVVRRVAEAHRSGGYVHLADLIRRFEDESPGGLVGSNLILEHIHMNGRGHYLAASEIYETLLRSGRFPGMGEGGRLSYEEACRRTGYGPLDDAFAASFMAVMLRRWPFEGTFGNEAEIRFMEARVREAREKMDPVEREAFDGHPVGATVLQLYHRVGKAWLEAGEYEKAAVRFRLLAEMLPVVPQAWIDLARSLAGAGREEEARGALGEAVHLGADPAATAADPLLAPLGGDR
ncbi:MAG: tetratricopeptide repeat protein [Candidatus Eisenbacteria bacterium]